MKGFRRITLLLLVLVLLGGATVCGAEELPLSDWEFEVLRIVNQERAAQKLDPLTAFDAIQSACDVRAAEIDGCFSHTRPDGSTCFTALEQAGIRYWYAGENIACGYRSPAAVMVGWMNSEGHRANILTPEFTHMGVGYEFISSHDWVQLFCSLSGESYTSAEIVVPGTAEVGTLIDEMYIHAVLENSACGKCYLPIMSEFVTGYDPTLLGTQTCQAEFLGFTCTFQITLVSPCADGHSYTSVVTPPTCTDLGFTTHTCTVCGDSHRDTYTAPTGHSFTPAAGLDPTCTEEGYVEYACSNCWDPSVTYQEVLPATGHHYNNVAVTAPTCTEEGYTTHTCSQCGSSYSDTYTAPTGHSFGSWSIFKEPTCTASGSQSRSCASCGRTEEQTVPATGHNYDADITPPTCTQYGYTVHTCTGCGDRYNDTYTEPTGHSFGDWTVTRQPTCTAKGSQSRTCGTCGSSETQSTPFLGHTPVTDPAVPATCTQSGLSEGSHCSVCGTVLTAQTAVSATGHSYAAVVTPPTCTDQGFTTHACSACGDSYVDSHTAPVGHSYGDDGVCTGCQDMRLTILTQPSGQKVRGGTKAVFTVTAQGKGLTYQWQYRAGAKAPWKNCTADGNTTHTMQVSATRVKSGNQYRCVITDASGETVTTKTVYLYVLAVKTQPVPQKVKAGQTVKFTVAASGFNKTYQWQYKNARGVWVNATGTGNKTATLTVRATVALSARQYRCVITDAAGNTVTTTSAYLYVLGIRTQPVSVSAKAGAPSS